jgi:hypothetical protein
MGVGVPGFVRVVVICHERLLVPLLLLQRQGETLIDEGEATA